MPADREPLALARRLVACASKDVGRLPLTGIYYHERGYWMATDGRRLFATSVLPKPQAPGLYKANPMKGLDFVPWPEGGGWPVASLMHDNPKCKAIDGKPSCLTRIPDNALAYRWDIPAWVGDLKSRGASAKAEDCAFVAVRPQRELPARTCGGEETTLPPLRLDNNFHQLPSESAPPLVINLDNVNVLAGEYWYLHLAGSDQAWLTSTKTRNLWECPTWMLLAGATPKGRWSAFRAP